MTIQNLQDLIHSIRAKTFAPVLTVTYLTGNKLLGDYIVDHVYTNTLQLRPTEDDGRSLLYIPNPLVCPSIVDTANGILTADLFDNDTTSVYSHKPIYRLTFKVPS